MSALTTVFASTPFKLFFAAWTGIYMVQLLYGKETRNEWAIMGAAFVITLFVLHTSNDAS